MHKPMKGPVDIGQPTLSIVIPTYGSPESLPSLSQRIRQTMLKMGCSYEMIFVDDRCPKGSWQALQKLVAHEPHIRCLRLSRNFGQHKAIAAGLMHSRGQWAAVIDCDLEDPPETIAEMWTLAHTQAADVVLGRRKEKKHGFFKRLFAYLYFVLLRALNPKLVGDSYGTLSLLSRKVIDAYNNFGDVNRHHALTLSWLGFNTVRIDYTHQQRFSGKSSYSPIKLIRHAMTGIYFHSTSLLKLIITVGIALSLLSVAAAIFLVARYYLQSALPGWTSLAVLLLLMSGFILISVGVVGLYIGVIFEQVKARPLFLIDTELKSTE